MIKDSGTRREFDTGAVRDCTEGKGRCDRAFVWNILCLIWQHRQNRKEKVSPEND